MRMDRRAGIVALDTLYTWEKYEYVDEYTYEESSTTSTVYFNYPSPLYDYYQTSNTTQTITSYGFYVGTSYSFNNSNGRFTVDQSTAIYVDSSDAASTAIGKYYISTSSSSSVSGTTLYHIIDASVTNRTMTLTVERFVSYSNHKYVGTSFSFDNTTGNFTVNQTSLVYFTSSGVSNNIGKYYIEDTIVSGSYTGSTVYHITDSSYDYGDSYVILTVAPLTSSLTSNKIKGAYICDVKSNNLIRYPFNGPQDGYWYIFKYTDPFTYSSNYVDRGISYMDSKYYKVYEFNSSGTFTPTKPISNMGVWICGGGVSGQTGNSSSNYGGAGSYVNLTNVNIRNPITVTIGAGGSGNSVSGGTTSVAFSESPSISTLSATSGSGKNGGTGAGKGGKDSSSDPVGTGDGLDKHVFNSPLFNSYCDGGGGGLYENKSSSEWSGGCGGTNGNNGSDYGYGGVGGGLFGGNGGGEYTSGYAATGYGSGGGGGTYYYSNSDSHYKGLSGGSGYQGACFIRIPLSQGSYEYSLPEGYTKLDYVQSTAAQAIDTGVSLYNSTQNIGIDCEFSLNAIQSGNNVACIFGCWFLTAGGWDLAFVFEDYKGVFSINRGTSFSNITMSTSNTYKVTMSTRMGIVDIKNTTTKEIKSFKINYSDIQTVQMPTVSIFSRHYDNRGTKSYDYKSRIKLYSFRMYDANGLIRNFIPAKNSSNVAGLYDTVTGKFYTSNTGTNLIAGNVIG